MTQYEMAFRMQTSIPEVTDTSDEPEHIFDMYGKDSRDAGTYAANCLMARKLLEKGVRFVQLYHHSDLILQFYPIIRSHSLYWTYVS